MTFQEWAYSRRVPSSRHVFRSAPKMPLSHREVLITSRNSAPFIKDFSYLARNRRRSDRFGVPCRHVVVLAALTQQAARNIDHAHDRH